MRTGLSSGRSFNGNYTTSQYANLRRELLKVPSSPDLALEPFSDAQLFCFVESNSRELYETLDADLFSLQLRVIGELKRRAETDLSYEGIERTQELTLLRLCTEARLVASHGSN